MKNIIILGMSIFFSNALIMIFEIMGSRVIGHYVGTSIVVWSTLIAIILFFISLGNYYGGILADKKPDIRLVSYIFVFTSLLVLILVLSEESLLNFFYDFTSDIWFYTIIISIVFFGPVSFLLGMVSPIAMKLAITSLDDVGDIVGWFSGMSAMGAILGTLLAGFVFIPLFGTTSIILSIGCMSLMLAFINSIAYKITDIFLWILHIVILGSYVTFFIFNSVFL